MLSKLAYLTLCRSIQLLALVARGDAAKELEILVLRHQLAVLRRQSTRPQLGPSDRALRGAGGRWPRLVCQLPGLLGVLQVTIGLAMVAGYRRAGVWGTF